MKLGIEKRPERKKNGEEYSRDLYYRLLSFFFFWMPIFSLITHIYWCRFRRCTPYANSYPSSCGTPYNETEEVFTQDDAKICHINWSEGGMLARASESELKPFFKSTWLISCTETTLELVDIWGDWEITVAGTGQEDRPREWKEICEGHHST